MDAKSVSRFLHCSATADSAGEPSVVLICKLISKALLLMLCVLIVQGITFAQDKAHQVIVALDDSGSMRQSDPLRIRIEATRMFAAISSPQDRLGIIVFGGSAKWLHKPAAVAHDSLSPLADELDSLESREQKTDFAAPLQLALDYFSQQPKEVAESFQTSILLLTDGAPDPEPGKYTGDPIKANKTEAMDLISKLSAFDVKLYTVGLGKAVEGDFLSRLASQSGGLYSPADSSSKLSDAFLRAITRIWGLPAYFVTRDSGRFDWPLGSQADSALLFLFRDSQTTRLEVKYQRLLSTQHLEVFDAGTSTTLDGQVMGSKGPATLIACVHQPLKFDLVTPLPASVLTDTRVPVEVRLTAGTQPLWDRLFMHDSVVRITMSERDAGPNFVPMYPDEASRSFKGNVSTDKPGDFLATAQLTSPYGEVTGFLAKLHIRETAAAVPLQINVNVPPLPWPKITSLERISVGYSLPSGTARVQFEPDDNVAIQPSELTVDPQHTVSVVIASAKQISEPHTVPVTYVVYWSNGVQEDRRRGTLTVLLSPISLSAYLLRLKWWWVAFIVLGLFLWKAIQTIRGPKMAGVLVIKGQGAELYLQVSGRKVRVSETAGDEVHGGAVIRISTGHERELFTIRLRKDAGTWKPAITPSKGVPVGGPLLLAQGEALAVTDRLLQIKFENFQKV